MRDKSLQVAYVESGGNRCPYCKSDSIESLELPQVDLGYCSQKVVCCDCEKEWKDIYTLVGFETKKEGE